MSVLTTTNIKVDHNISNDTDNVLNSVPRVAIFC